MINVKTKSCREYNSAYVSAWAVCRMDETKIKCDDDAFELHKEDVTLGDALRVIALSHNDDDEKLYLCSRGWWHQVIVDNYTLEEK